MYHFLSLSVCCQEASLAAGSVVHISEAAGMCDKELSQSVGFLLEGASLVRGSPHHAVGQVCNLPLAWMSLISFRLPLFEQYNLNH